MEKARSRVKRAFSLDKVTQACSASLVIQPWEEHRIAARRSRAICLIGLIVSVFAGVSAICYYDPDLLSRTAKPGSGAGGPSASATEMDGSLWRNGPVAIGDPHSFISSHPAMLLGSERSARGPSTLLAAADASPSAVSTPPGETGTINAADFSQWQGRGIPVGFSFAQGDATVPSVWMGPTDNPAQPTTYETSQTPPPILVPEPGTFYLFLLSGIFIAWQWARLGTACPVRSSPVPKSAAFRSAVHFLAGKIS